MKKYFWSNMSILVMFILGVNLVSCSSDGGDDAETTLNVSSLSFNLSSSGDDTKSLTITSNSQWTISSADSWIHCSQYSGKGDATIEIYADANTSTQQRTASLNITAGDKSRTVRVIQAASGSPGPGQTCRTIPTEVLRFSDSFVSNYQCDADVKFFLAGVYLKTSLATLTESEIKKDLQDNGVRRSVEQAQYPVYTTGLLSNTAYTLVTLSFDKNDKLCDMVKYDITTKSNYGQPEVDLDDLSLSSDGNYINWQIKAKKGSNGVCSKFYTWFASGTSMSSQLFPPQTICWYLAKEIKANPSAHKTNIHASLDEYIKYVTGYSITSDVMEYLDGPKMQESAVTSVRGLLNPEGAYLIMWGMDATDELSGIVSSTSYVDFTEEDARKRLTSIGNLYIWGKKSYKSDKYSLVPFIK